MDGGTAATTAPVIELEQLRRALDLSSIGTGLTTLTGDMIYANRKLKTMAGRVDEPVTDWTILDLAREGDRDLIASAYDAVLNGDAPSFERELRLWTSQGAPFWGLLSGCLVRTNGGLPFGLLLHLRDITRLKAAEAKLQRREKRLRLALAAGRFADWEYDVATGLIQRGPLHDRIFGYEAATGEWSLQTLLDHVVPEDRARLSAAFAAAASAPQPLHQVYRIRRPSDGEVRWLESHADPELEDGQVTRLVGLVTDITEAHEAEARLAESEERYRLAAAAISEAVWDWDLMSDRVIWSDALRTSFGHAPEGLATDGAWWLERVHPEDIESVKALVQRVLAGEIDTFNCEYRFRRGDGEWAHVLDRAHILRDDAGKAVRLIGAMLDLSRRRKAEAELRAKEAQLRTILETVPVGIVMAELPSGAIVDGNSYVETLLKHPVLRSPDLRSFDEWVSYHADGTRVASHEYPLARMVLAGEEAPELEVHYERGDGVRAWTRIMGRPVRDETGALIGGVVAMVDVDAERRTKDSLESLNRELESRVSQQVAARLKAEELLRQSQKLEAVGQLTGGVAHDFNNLLTVMMGSLEEITDGLPQGHALQGPARLARSAAERGAALTSQLLSFARRQPQQPISISAADILEAIEGFVGRTLRENIVLRIEGRGEPRRFLADRAQLESAILNLCLNARDAMPSGGELVISATCTTLDPQDESSAEAPDPTLYCCLSVRDSGTGMDAETLRRAVEPFFTTKPPGQGTGLGLSMVYGFARQSGGEMRLRSEPGRGTTVSLYLPVTDQEPTPVEVMAEPGGRAVRVLVAEDNELLRSQVMRQLQALGHTVTAVPDGREALKALSGDEPFDLLFTDMVMPGGIGGDDLAEAAQRLRPGLPVLVTTGYADYFNVDLGVMRRVLTKPYRRAQLAAAINEILSET